MDVSAETLHVRQVESAFVWLFRSDGLPISTALVGVWYRISSASPFLVFVFSSLWSAAATQLPRAVTRRTPDQTNCTSAE
jgi:hypothetical protein